MLEWHTASGRDGAGYAEGEMDIQQLRRFLAVAEHENMLRAAAALNLTQPAMSRSIRALEDELQISLFDRTSKGVILTQFGKMLLSHVKVILNEHHRAVLNLSALRGGTRGQLSVGAGHTFATELLPQASAQLYAKSSRIAVRVKEGLYEDLVDSLRKGDIDIAFTLIPNALDRVEDLVIETLIEPRERVVARADHPLAGRKRLSIGELGKAKWVLPDQTFNLSSFLDYFDRSDADPPENVIKTSSIPFLQGMLEKSDFLAMISEQLVTQQLESGRLVILDTDFKLGQRRAGAIYRAFGTAPPALQLLLRKVRELCKSGEAA